MICMVVGMGVSSMAQKLGPSPRTDSPLTLGAEKATLVRFEQLLTEAMRAIRELEKSSCLDLSKSNSKWLKASYDVRDAFGQLSTLHSQNIVPYAAPIERSLSSIVKLFIAHPELSPEGLMSLAKIAPWFFREEPAVAARIIGAVLEPLSQANEKATNNNHLYLTLREALSGWRIVSNYVARQLRFPTITLELLKGSIALAKVVMEVIPKIARNYDCGLFEKKCAHGEPALGERTLLQLAGSYLAGDVLEAGNNGFLSAIYAASLKLHATGWPFVFFKGEKEYLSHTQLLTVLAEMIAGAMSQMPEVAVIQDRGTQLEGEKRSHDDAKTRAKNSVVHARQALKNCTDAIFQAHRAGSVPFTLLRQPKLSNFGTGEIMTELAQALYHTKRYYIAWFSGDQAKVCSRELYAWYEQARQEAFWLEA